MAEKNKKDERTRNWTMVVYPESAPKNWREILDNLHVPYLVSPLHDKDLNPDGKVKKPHWHVVLVFENMKAYHQIKELADKLNAPIPQKVESLRGMVRYLAHTDNPEKYQYNREDIENHGVDDINKYFETTASLRAMTIALTKYVITEQITSYAELIIYAMKKGDDWFDVVSQHTIYFSAIVKSVWQDQQNAEVEKNDRMIADAINSDQVDQEDRQKLSKEEKIARARAMSDLGVNQSIIADTLGISERTVRYYLNKK